MTASASAATMAAGEAIETPGPAVKTIAKPAAGVPVDRLGDPLPPGALARFGTSRLHQGGAVYGVAQFGDDIVSVGDGISHHGPTVNFWSATTGRLGATAQVEFPTAARSDEKGRFVLVASAQPILFERTDAGIRSTTLPKREGAVMDVAIARDGKIAVVLRNDGCEVDLYETSPVRHLRCVGCSAPIPESVAISDDGGLIAVGDKEGGLFVVDGTGKLMLAHAQPEPLRGAPVLAFLPGSKELIEARANGALARWIPKLRRTSFQREKAFDGDAMSIAISEDGADVVVGSSAGHADVTLLAASTGEKRWETGLTGWASFGYSVTFDRSGRVVVGTGAGSVEHLDRKDGKPARLFEGGEEDVNAVAFLDEDRVLSFGSHIELWSVASPLVAPKRPIADEEFSDFLVSARGDVLVASTRYGLVKVQTRDWKRTGTLDGLEGAFYGASADLKSVYLGTFGTFERIDTARMKKLPPLPGATEKRTPECVAVSPDGSRVAAVLSEQKGRPRLYRWETTTAAPAIQSIFESDDRWTCAFASNGALVIGTDKGIYVVGKDGEANRIDKERSVWRIKADPKRPRIALADTDEKIALLDLTTGAVREIGSHLDYIDELAFSPSGERLASASQDDSVVIWDVR